MEEQAPVPQPKIYQPLVSRRRQLLPWWVLFFTWFFMLAILALPIGVTFSLFNKPFTLSLFGLTTDNPFSMIGVFLMIIFTFKGIVAFNIWLEKKGAISLAKVDAILSIAFSLIGVFYNIAMPDNRPGIHSFNLPLDLIVIIPYFIKMNKVQYDWENFGEASPDQNDVPADAENI